MGIVPKNKAVDVLVMAGIFTVDELQKTNDLVKDWVGCHG